MSVFFLIWLRFSPILPAGPAGHFPSAVCPECLYALRNIFINTSRDIRGVYVYLVHLLDEKKKQHKNKTDIEHIK